MSARDEIVVVGPSDAVRLRQDVPVRVGISGATAGATGLSLHLTSFPPGGETKPHKHLAFETAIYGIRGSVAIFYGERLEEYVVVTEGSFCFIPPGLPHKGYNLSETEVAEFVSARNDPADQERVVLVEPEVDGGTTDRRARILRERLAAGESLEPRID
jgi:uncharacterized RmlC-like cupin family protein